jgi:eukaryotic-like serine/threonine-protein kinase
MSSYSDSNFETGQQSADHDDATRFVPEQSDADLVPLSSLGELSDEHEFELSDESAELGSGPLGVIGEYLLLERIGAGGMGQVYRAEHRTMNREVAIKLLDEKLATSPNLINQFFSEVRAVAKLMHPNIVTAFDAGRAGNHHYLVMELVRGESLLQRINRQGPLSSREAVEVLEQSARALQCAHSFGVVHRDIKPSNMMLAEGGTLKVLDFGLALLGKMEADRDPKNIFMGTPEFMSPEQIEDADDVDPRSDLYSLGATLFYLLTGRTMYSGERMQVALAQIRQQAPALFLERSDVDLRLDAIFQRLVQKNRANRYADASELLDSLHTLNLTDSGGGISARSGSPCSSHSPFNLFGSRLSADQSTDFVRGTSTLTKKSQIVAIDLGMIASTAAYFHPKDGPQPIYHGEDNHPHLRNMLWSSRDKIKIGASAVAMRPTHAAQVLHSVQRLIGATETPRPLLGASVPPIVPLAAMLRQIMDNAAVATDQADNAVVTVPSCYDQLHRRAVRDACRVAGIDLVQLVDKSVAAGLSWLEVNSRVSGQGDRSKPCRLLYVHLGGTGLEAAVLEAGPRVVRQLSSSGHWRLGTLRWQHLLTEYLVGVLRDRTGQSIQEDVAASTRLQRTVELTMDRLTRSGKVELRFEWRGVSIQQIVTQEGLLKIAPKLSEAITQCVSDAVRKADLELEHVDHLLLAGAMMKMRPLQQLVTSRLPHRTQIVPLAKSDIARGAALQAHYLSQMTHSLKSDELHGVGCAAYDLGLLARHHQRGSLHPRVLMSASIPLPASCTKTLRPQVDSESGKSTFPTLHLIESTNVGKENWNRLARLQPNEVFPDYAGNDPLQLRFDIDESGICSPSLLWPAGNRQVPFSGDELGELSEQELEQWQRWLETAMLCSTD